LILAGLAAVQCSGAHGACDAFYDGLSSYLSRCLGASSDAVAGRDRYDLWCGKLVAAPGVKADLGACGASLNTAACGDVSSTTASCNLDGTLANGTACGSNLQCQSGFCKGAGIHESFMMGPNGPVLMTSETCGVCTAEVAVGAACATGDQCVTDSACLNGTCSAFGDVGAGCGTAGPVCKTNLHCDSTSHCAARSAEGGACMTGSDCVVPLRCVGGSCAAGGDVGASCTGSSSCKNGLVCDSSRTCKQTVHAAPGATCDGELTLCSKGLCSNFGSLDGGTGTCPAVIADGQSCDPSDAAHICDDYAYCVSGTCQLFDTGACK
jgi:hypothetical protein